MSKTLNIDFSEERLLAIASDAIESHNLIGALRMLNKNAEINGNAEESYMMYAEVFDDMELYEKCVNGWFRYIDYVTDYEEDADLSEAYEGLAVSFMNMGMDNFAAYYYNKLLMETADGLSEESRRDVINAFLSSEQPALKFAYPPKLADFSKEMETGVNFMRANDYESAVKEFSKVDEGNEKYSVARNYIAMCRIICDKCDEAEQECLSILEKNPEDIQALTTLAAVKTQQKKTEESKALAYKLLSLNPTATEDIYKIATVACENCLHEEAYSLFCKLEEELAYDSSLLYFKAISAYNCGKTDKSLEAFDKLLTIYPEAVTAAYWQEQVKSNAALPEENRETLSYFYRMPLEQRESNLQVLTAFNRLGKANAERFADEVDLTDCILWCFDEGDGRGSYELQTLGAVCAVKAHCDDLVRDLLINADLPDSLKIEMLNALALRNEDARYGVVACNIFKKITIPRLNVGVNKRKSFLKAYALLVSRFAMINGDYVYLINSSATKLYFSLEEGGRLEQAKDYVALAAAVLYLSGIREAGTTADKICAFFGADRNKFNNLLGV